MSVTKLEQMVDPEVLADMISAELEDAIRFAPMARMDRTLAGQPGSTVTVPKFEYIGPAVDVAEGEAIDTSQLKTSTEQFSIKKAGKGAELTDESLLSGYGDPLGEAARQLRMSIAEKVDNDVLKALDDTTVTVNIDDFDIDGIDKAIGVFNDEDPEQMVLIANPKTVATLRKAVGNDWTRATDLGDNIIVNGTFGEVLGAQVVRSRKVEDDTAYLVKAGALAIYLKRDIQVEDDRDITRKTTLLTTDQHYGAHLYDESKAIKITTGGGSDGGDGGGES